MRRPSTAARHNVDVTDLTPSEALTTCERSLRALISAVGPGVRTDWLATWTKPEQRAKWTSRAGEEQAKRQSKGVTAVTGEALDYAEFYELIDLVERQWTYFAAALGKKADTGALLRRFDDLRNSVAHSRELLPFERDLLSGIAGEIRNRVATFMSTVDELGNIYPTIDFVVDSYGHRLAPDPTSGGEVRVPTVLHPGDIVTFDCAGTDPQNRTLTWRLVVINARGQGRQEEQGDRVSLRWLVEPHNVRENCMVHISLKADSAYHRFGDYDSLIAYHYRVRPPT